MCGLLLSPRFRVRAMEDAMSPCAGMTLRPYEVLCAVCSLGRDEPAANDERSEKLLASVRTNPDMPITLRCNAGDVFAYQDPGTADDTPEGAEFNVRRDLEILFKLNLPPGCTLPARIIFHRLLEQIESVSGICGYPSVTCDAWRGCPRADSGDYERGRAKGIEAIIPPRDEEEMKRDKAESLKAMYAAEAISVRPHILVCAVCQYGGGVRPPFPADNLPELIQLILKEPHTRITLARCADWMMCAPCPHRNPETNACVIMKGYGGLPNQMRDLRVLQKLGLSFGDTLEAAELYKLILERIPNTLEICKVEQADPSVWASRCGSATAECRDYPDGRKMLQEEFA